MNKRRPRRQTERSSGTSVPRDFQLEDAVLLSQPCIPDGAEQIIQDSQRPANVLRVHEAPPSSMAFDQPPFSKFIYRLPDRYPAHAILLNELTIGREAIRQLP